MCNATHSTLKTNVSHDKCQVSQEVQGVMPLMCYAKCAYHKKLQTSHITLKVNNYMCGFEREPI